MILAIVGPTGVGKTKMSVELAKKHNAIIINCDSMQVYKELNIGTAKITEEEKEGVPHYLFDIKEVTEDYSVFDYQKDVRKLIEENKDKNIIIVGGTGLYLKAALYDYRFETETTNETFDELTNEELYQRCLEKDPNMDIHINNRKRLVRFFNKTTTTEKTNEKLYDFKIIGLTTNREILYDRINKRVDVMIKDGLVKEVENFYNKGIKPKSIMTGIGYKELYDYFDNKITLEEAIDLIKKNSRHYAKRQYTFFNHQFDIKWFDVDFTNFNNTVNEVEEYIIKDSQ